MQTQYFILYIMKAIIKKLLLNALAITGGIIGVGFASGKEVLSFFVKSGYIGLVFCLLAGCLFTVFSYMILTLEARKNHTSDKIWLNKKRNLTPNAVKFVVKNNENSKINFLDKIFNMVLFICQLAICSAMFAGISSLLGEVGILGFLNLCAKVAVLFISFLYLRWFGSVFSINTLLSFLLLVLLTVVMLFNLKFVGGTSFTPDAVTFMSFVMPVLYVGMNMLTVYPLIAELAKGIKSKRQKFGLSFAIGLFLTLSLCLVGLSILLFGGDMLCADMVMLTIAFRGSNFLGSVYYIVLMLGILTTLLSTCYGASNLIRARVGQSLSIFVCLCLAFVLSFVGFSSIIEYLYPFLGFVCMLFLIFKLCCCGKVAKSLQNKKRKMHEI